MEYKAKLSAVVWVISGFCLTVIGLVFGHMIWQNYATLAWFEENGTKVVGTITYVPTTSESWPNITIEFPSSAGTNISSQAETHSYTHEVGDDILIWYNSENPDQIAIASPDLFLPFWGTGVFLFAGTLLLLYGVGLLLPLLATKFAK
jgi:hypothetical protein